MDEAEHCDRIALIIAGKIIALDSPAGLKQNLSYSVYALHVDDFINIFEKVEKLDYIEEAAIFGSEIHLLCAKDFPLKPELGKELKIYGVRNYKIEKVAPSLEDVFVTHARRLGV